MFLKQYKAWLDYQIDLARYPAIFFYWTVSIVFISEILKPVYKNMSLFLQFLICKIPYIIQQRNWYEMDDLHVGTFGVIFIRWHKDSFSTCSNLHSLVLMFQIATTLTQRKLYN